MYFCVLIKTKYTGMKRLILISATLITIATACNNSSADQALTGEEQQAAATTGKEYTADTTASSISWRATHKGGMAPRFGTLKITEGTIAADSGKVTGGSFTVNINSLVVDSTSVTEKDKKAIDLQNHLKSPDFFDAAKYPAAKFAITNISAFNPAEQKSMIDGATNMVSGNLTIKDSTVNVTFPARILVSDNNVEIAAKFTVDRTSWNLTYGAKGDPSDWLISKDFELTLDVKATAK